MNFPPRNRRQFFTRIGTGMGIGYLGALAGNYVSSLSAEERSLDLREKILAPQDPPVTDPRATDGDSRFEPSWEERLTITVGTQTGDLVGSTDRVIQAAVDYASRMGGGTVRMAPGRYVLRNSVVLPSRVRIVGSGDETVITRGPSEATTLADDSNWFDQEITLQDAKGFQVGDGILLETKNPHHGGATVIKRTLVARSGNRFKLNDGLRENVWLSGKPTCKSLFPLFTSERAEDVVIEHLTLDGNRANVENLNGNYGGCIFIQDCNRFTFRHLTTRNYNGDGISFQVSHDVVVENCHSHDNSDLGLHPGSGSQRPRILNNRLDRNNLGLFWCWGVRYGIAEGNKMDGNRSYGISIGHCDTDNVMRNNEVRRSGKVGILFRDEASGRDFWANRNRLEHNLVVDNGDDDGIAIDITGKTHGIQLVGNTIQETRAPRQRIGIRLGSEVAEIVLNQNQIEGFALSVQDLRVRS